MDAAKPSKPDVTPRHKAEILLKPEKARASEGLKEDPADAIARKKEEEATLAAERAYQKQLEKEKREEQLARRKEERDEQRMIRKGKKGFRCGTAQRGKGGHQRCRKGESDEHGRPAKDHCESLPRLFLSFSGCFSNTRYVWKSETLLVRLWFAMGYACTVIGRHEYLKLIRISTGTEPIR